MDDLTLECEGNMSLRGKGAQNDTIYVGDRQRHPTGHLGSQAQASRPNNGMAD